MMRWTILILFSLSILAQPGQRGFKSDSSFEDLGDFEDLVVETPEQIEARAQLEAAEAAARELLLRHYQQETDFIAGLFRFGIAFQALKKR